MAFHWVCSDRLYKIHILSFICLKKLHVFISRLAKLCTIFLVMDYLAVLLDHGIYKELDEGFRLNYCQLWEALILLNSKKIQHLGEQFGVAKYSRYFPVIFVGRTIDR